jgi:hypothetical protein
MELEAERLKSLAAKPRFVPCRTGGSRRGPHVSLICQSKSEHIIRDDDIADVDGRTLTLDVVVDIFNRVNSGGTKLSKGDLALAKICADWPEARDTMKAKLKEWTKADYHFNLDWLLRSVNTALTGEAKFQFLQPPRFAETGPRVHDPAVEDIWSRNFTCLNSST